MPNLKLIDEYTDISEEAWRVLRELVSEELLMAYMDYMIYGTYPPPHRNVATSAVAVVTSGPVLPRGPRFAALGALIPTSSGSTTTN